MIVNSRYMMLLLSLQRGWEEGKDGGIEVGVSGKGGNGLRRRADQAWNGGGLTALPC